MDVVSEQSEATRAHHSGRRLKLSDVAKEVDSLNAGAGKDVKPLN